MHLRDAIYNAHDGPAAQRAAPARREGARAAARGGSSQLVGQVAYHFARANDTEKGIRYAVEAGDIATRTLAHAEATEFYRTAIELIDLAGVDEAQKAEVREKLADAYYRSNDYARAMQAFQFLLKSIPGARRTRRSRAPTSRAS